MPATSIDYMNDPSDGNNNAASASGERDHVRDKGQCPDDE